MYIIPGKKFNDDRNQKNHFKLNKYVYTDIYDIYLG